MVVKSKPLQKDAAICFSGLVKHFELCYPYIKKRLLDNFSSYDVFCCVEDDGDADKIKLLNPTITEKIKSSDVDKIIAPELKRLKKQNYKRFFFPESRSFNLRNVYQQIYKIDRAFKLLENYMKEKNISYKYFIRIRFDFLPLNSIDPSKLKMAKEEIIVPNMNKGPEKDQLNDMFSVTNNFETFRTYCTLYDHFSKTVLEKLPFNPSRRQKYYFHLEKIYMNVLSFLFKRIKKKKFFRNLFGFCLLLPKKIYKKFKNETRASLERVLFYSLKADERIKIREETINFMILRDPMTGLLFFGSLG